MKARPEVNGATFDSINVRKFRNRRIGTVLLYVWLWIFLLLQIAVLASDTYTCVNILAFDRWLTKDYQVYEYRVAKWIFTGCILFRFVLIIYHLGWAIYTYRTRNIALAYLNEMTQQMYTVRLYDYHCLFSKIERKGLFEWACFHTYFELDHALEILVADLPRQVVNILTLRFYATGGNHDNNILENIRYIATTNLRLAAILSFQLFSVVIFAIFFFRFCIGILAYIPVRVRVAHSGYTSLKTFCYHAVNEKVRLLVFSSQKLLLDSLADKALKMDLSESTIDLSHIAFGSREKRDLELGYSYTPLDRRERFLRDVSDSRLSEKLMKRDFSHESNAASNAGVETFGPPFELYPFGTTLNDLSWSLRDTSRGPKARRELLHGLNFKKESLPNPFEDRHENPFRGSLPTRVLLHDSIHESLGGVENSPPNSHTQHKYNPFLHPREPLAKDDLAPSHSLDSDLSDFDEVDLQVYDSAFESSHNAPYAVRSVSLYKPS